MFRTVSIIGFIAALIAIVVHFLLCRPGADRLFGKDRSMHFLDPVRYLVFLFTLLFVEQKWNIIGVLRKLIFLLALLCFVVLVITSFVPVIILKKSISGYWLMLHATASPVFSACLAILAVIWADKMQLDKNYWPWLNTIIRRLPRSPEPPHAHELKAKICFWCIIFLALPVILSAVLSMFPLFGTGGQELLLVLHRYSTLLLALFSIVFLYLMALGEMIKTAAE